MNKQISWILILLIICNTLLLIGLVYVPIIFFRFYTGNIEIKTSGSVKVTIKPSSYTDADIEMLAKTVYGEARGCTTEEQRLVIWTVLQRVDDKRFPNTIEAVITSPNQFVGFCNNHPIIAEISNLVEIELFAWTSGSSPPTLEPYAKQVPYLFFHGDGVNNWYRSSY